LKGDTNALPEYVAWIRKRLVVFDEVHQLPDPSRLLKIGADGFSHLKILATGSSTLAATQKFSDSLRGRKRVVELVPVLHEELPAFGVTDLRERLLRGGLPPALLVEKHNPEFYAECRIPTLRVTCRRCSGWKSAPYFFACWNC
jgi:predicted AAA+ superfamily ATPase